VARKSDSEYYKEWRKLVNLTPAELRYFMRTREGRKAGLTKRKAAQLGIRRGRDSARWILKMKARPYKRWTPKMLEWMRAQVRFIKRMRGNRGPLFKDGEMTRKHTSLLIWGHDPIKYDRRRKK
jgi:hypothetical protein